MPYSGLTHRHGWTNKLVRNPALQPDAITLPSSIPCSNDGSLKIVSCSLPQGIKCERHNRLAQAIAIRKTARPSVQIKKSIVSASGGLDVPPAVLLRQNRSGRICHFCGVSRCLDRRYDPNKYEPLPVLTGSASEPPVYAGGSHYCSLLRCDPKLSSPNADRQPEGR